MPSRPFTIEHLRRGTARNVELMLIVVEPYYRPLEAGARTAELAREFAVPHVRAVANKVRGADDLVAVEAYCARRGLRLLGRVPMDEAFVEAECAGKAPIDYAPHSPGLEAIREMASRIGALEAAALGSMAAGQSSEAQRTSAD